MFFQSYKYSYTERREKRFKLFRICSIIFLIFIFQQLITSYIVTAYRIQSDTMQPSLSAGDMIVTSPLYSAQQGIERGSLVIVEPLEKPPSPFVKKMLRQITAFFTFQLFHPFQSDIPSQAKPFIRRVVGIPGDTVYMDGFVLHIKTKEDSHFLTEFEVAQNDYNINIENLPDNWDTDLPFSGTYPRLTLQDGEYFVLCDNRIASNDSRLWGPVSAEKHIKARIFMRYWPFSRVSLF
ncbi:MAG: signal peptidase I [Treponema sp.]